KTPSFYVVPAKQIFKCFGCGVGGDVFKFVQLREKVGFAEAREILAAKAGISLTDRYSRAPAETDKSEVARVNDWAMRWFRKQLESPAGQVAREYAAKRGLSDVTLETFGIGFAPDAWDALGNAAKSAGIPAKLLTTSGLAKQRTGGTHYDAFRNRLMFP